MHPRLEALQKNTNLHDQLIRVIDLLSVLPIDWLLTDPLTLPNMERKPSYIVLSEFFFQNYMLHVYKRNNYTPPIPSPADLELVALLLNRYGKDLLIYKQLPVQEAQVDFMYALYSQLYNEMREQQPFQPISPTSSTSSASSIASNSSDFAGSRNSEIEMEKKPCIEPAKTVEKELRTSNPKIYKKRPEHNFIFTYTTRPLKSKKKSKSTVANESPETEVSSKKRRS